MTERDKSSLTREAELKKIQQFYEDQGYLCERILSQNSPSSIILFTEDEEKVERYIEIKFIVKKPEYEPDDDIAEFAAEIEKRAVKQVKADINKKPKKERLAAEQLANEKVKQIIESYKQLSFYYPLVNS